jgi:hypothetical protein
MFLSPLCLFPLLLLTASSDIFVHARQPSGSYFGGSVEWSLLPEEHGEDSARRTVEFLIRTHWQRSFSAYKGTSSDGFSAVGDQLPLQGQSSVFFSFGDGSPVTELTATVTAIDRALDIVSLLSVVHHSYSAPCQNVSLTPAYFNRPQSASGDGSSAQLPVLTIQEMRAERTPWIAQLTACCAATAATLSGGDTVLTSALVDYTFTASSPKLSFASVVLANHHNTTLPLLSEPYTGQWPCKSTSLSSASASSSASTPSSSSPESCQWQDELATTTVQWSVPSHVSPSGSASRFVFNGTSGIVLGCSSSCDSFLLFLQVIMLCAIQHANCGVSFAADFSLFYVVMLFSCPCLSSLALALMMHGRLLNGAQHLKQ